MSVPVYLAKLAVKNPSDHRLAKIKRLCDAVGLADKVKPLGTVGEDEVVAIKLHFGEAGNDTYLHPTFVRQVVDCVKATGARPSTSPPAITPWIIWKRRIATVLRPMSWTLR